MTKAIFYDTYALIEIIRGNENYKKYQEDIIITTKLNLFELYFIRSKEDQKQAKEEVRKLKENTIGISLKVIILAADYKRVYSKQKLSMVDCIGYILAKEKGVKFLTGDKEFEHKENVEFVK